MFFLATFKILCVSSLHQFDYDVSGHEFLWVYSLWGFTEFLDPVGLCMFPNLRSFSQYFFSITLFLLSLILMTQMLELPCWPTGPWGSVHVPNLCLCYSDWVISIDLSLSPVTPFSIISILLLSLSGRFLFFFFNFMYFSSGLKFPFSNFFNDF